MTKSHGTFRIYSPVVPLEPGPTRDKALLLQSIGAIFARREDGADWYDVASTLQHSAYAMAVNGLITSVSRDPQAFPVTDGMTLIETTEPAEIGWRWDGVVLSPPAVDLAASVNAERDRRIRSGFVWDGKRYQSDDRSRAAIMEAMTIAAAAIAAGKQPGDLRWSDPGRDFAWIAADNSSTPMDAQTCLAFGMAASDHKSDLVLAARAIKSLNPIPQDFAHDRHWT